MVSSSSGPGRLVLIQKIAGSTPAGITRKSKKTFRSFFDFLGDFRWEIRTREAGSHRAHSARSILPLILTNCHKCDIIIRYEPPSDSSIDWSD